MPMPKDILPILAKDEEKQKAIEQKAADAHESTKTRKADDKNPSAIDAPKNDSAKLVGGRKMFMKIPEIPPFNPTKRKPEALPVPPSASQNIPLAASPTPSAASQASGSQAAAKLNPNANSFVFKPNPAAGAFNPVSGPFIVYHLLDMAGAGIIPQLRNGGASNKCGECTLCFPKRLADRSIQPFPIAGPSGPPLNHFFRDQTPRRPEGFNPRDDFNPWRNGQVASPASICASSFTLGDLPLTSSSPAMAVYWAEVLLSI